MSRFDLGMSLDYCSTWGVVEAIREFFQNALDAETVNAENKMFFEYSKEDSILRIGNKKGVLDTSTLLLGSSSKRNQAETIGQHGEGYKVATVVLLRLGKTIKVYNRGNNEVWTAKVVRSRRYNADVCVFDVERVSLFRTSVDYDLVFEVGGISQEEYDSIVESNLHLQNLDAEKIIQAGDSRILLDKCYAGRIFVNGLFVCKSKVANFGYDIAPSLMKLDRDRGLVDSYDLQFALAKIICSTKDKDFIYSSKDIWDGQYIRYYLSSYLGNDDLSSVFDKVYSEFTSKHGEDAVPVTSTDEFNRLKKNGYNAVLVNNNDYHYITGATGYTSSVSDDSNIKSNEELADDLESWFSDVESVSPDLYNSGSDLISAIVRRLRE